MCLNGMNKAPTGLSLAGKLAIHYAITTFAVLVIASGILYWSVLDHLEREHKHLLVTKISDLRHYFKTSSTFGKELHELIDIEHHHSEMPHSSAIHPGVPHHVFVRILDSHGELLLQSSLKQPLPKTLKFPVANDIEDDIAVIKLKSNNNQQYLLGSAWALTNYQGQTKKILLQAMLGLAQDETLLSEYQHTLIGVLAFGVLASALAGFWITRRGLLPLRQITNAIQTINAHQLNERVGSKNWPHEIALLADSFDQMLARLDRSFGQLSRFSADLAHELRTPINNLMGETEVALSRERNTEEYCKILESNIEECSRIARMIDELLFLARAEDPKTEINRQLLSIEDEFQTVLEFYEGIAAEHQLEINCQSNQIVVYADQRLLRRVLTNLVSNAIRYTPEGGQVTLFAETMPDQSIKISVSDNGIGIPQDQIAHVFDRFYRVDKSRHRDTQGTGLGLAIVKSIMHLHAGTVLARNNHPQGAVLELIFPPSEKMTKL